MRSSRIRTRDNRMVIVPNSVIGNIPFPQQDIHHKLDPDAMKQITSVARRLEHRS